MSMASYNCPTCGTIVSSEKLGTAVHNHYVKELASVFLKKGHEVIQEGTFPRIPETMDIDWVNHLKQIKIEFRAQNWEKVARTWREPDIIVLQKPGKDQPKISAIVEVLGTAEDYRILTAKVLKIKEFVRPESIIVFDAIRYVDRFLSKSRKARLKKILDLKETPTTYAEIDEYYQQKLRKDFDIEFEIWNEDNLKEDF